jgi:hypothetical protein
MRGEFFVQPCEYLGGAQLQATGRAQLLRGEDIDEMRNGIWAGAILIGPQQQPPLAPHALGAALLLPQLLRESAADPAAWEPDYGRSLEGQYRRAAAARVAEG